MHCNVCAVHCLLPQPFTTVMTMRRGHTQMNAFALHNVTQSQLTPNPAYFSAWYCVVHCLLPQPLTPVMTMERSPTATAEQKAAAYQEVLQPEGPFKQRLALLDKWLVCGAEGAGRFGTEQHS